MATPPHDSDDLFVPVEAVTRGTLEDVGLDAPRFFPSPLSSTEDGLVCVGGRLDPEWLLDAYRHGIFPWPVWDDEPMAWWSLDPRAIIELERFHVSRRLRRTLAGGKFAVTCNRDFVGVIQGCATASGRVDSTWLTPAMIDAYIELHRLGHAHSVEVWCDLPLPSGEGRGEGALETRQAKHPHPNPLPLGEGMRLVGGTYGVAIGAFFAAESMFYRVSEASKVAVAHLVAHLRSRGYALLDIQQWTPHTGRLGALEIPRHKYLRRLALATQLPTTFGCRLTGDPLALGNR